VEATNEKGKRREKPHRKKGGKISPRNRKACHSTISLNCCPHI
jgi:hypothetical protein